MYVVEHYGHAMAWGFGEANISGDYSLKDLSAEKAAQIGRNLARERGSLVIHRQENAFDLKLWIERAPDAHQRV